jgi:hypothetical protein
MISDLVLRLVYLILGAGLQAALPSAGARTRNTAPMRRVILPWFGRVIAVAVSVRVWRSDSSWDVLSDFGFRTFGSSPLAPTG